jgi:hypothetical protein
MRAQLTSDDLTGQIIGAAMEVSKELRPGQDERIYERALEVTGCKLGFSSTSNKPRWNGNVSSPQRREA